MPGHGSSDTRAPAFQRLHSLGILPEREVEPRALPRGLLFAEARTEVTMTDANPKRSPHVDAADRPELFAALTFLEGTSSQDWGLAALAEWLEQFVSMARFAEVHESPVGPISLHLRHQASAIVDAKARKLLAAARARVIAALRGFRGSPPDDRFLSATIFAGRVRRTSATGRSEWIARPEPTASLSTVVITLLTADILTHREQYDRELCVCDVCGRMWFAHDGVIMARCSEHSTPGEKHSGFVRTGTPPTRGG